MGTTCDGKKIVSTSRSADVSGEYKYGNTRSSAVNIAWKMEKELILKGHGTRDWTVAQQIEIIVKDRATGFEGQHMKDVNNFPAFKADPNNIQFLHEGAEHHDGAHKSHYRDGSNGMFISSTGEMLEFGKDELIPVPVIELTDKFDINSLKFVSELPKDFGYDGDRRGDYFKSKNKYKYIRSIKKVK